LICLVETLDSAYLWSPDRYSAEGTAHLNAVAFIVELVGKAAGRNPFGSCNAVLAEGL
jgi:hypothetical protein